MPTGPFRSRPSRSLSARRRSPALGVPSVCACSVIRALLILCGVLIAGCGGERSYEVTGRVAGFGDDAHTIIIEHQDVPGFMPAMTMPFQARDSTSLRDLTVGDAVAFELVVHRDRTWIENLERLPDDAVPDHPAGSPDTFSPGAAQILEPGDPVPDASLITHADTTLELSELRGRRVLLTFIYTRCPLPDFCPLMSRHFSRLQPMLGELEEPPVHLLSVSVDPAHDSPEVLRDYAERYTDDLTSWTFATGDSAAVDSLAGRFGVFYRSESGEITHNLVTALLDENGQVHRIWRGNDWQPEDVLAVLEREEMQRM